MNAHTTAAAKTHSLHAPYTLALGIAGNFANHLEQAGEANDFACILCEDEDAPKGLFPFYIESTSHTNPTQDYLTRNCFNNTSIILPHDKTLGVQAEPEVALECEIVYETNNKGVNIATEIKPLFFMACNDASIRNDNNATKLSQKKNFSTGSKGLGAKIAIDTFTESGICEGYSIASFLRHEGGAFEAYGECSTLSSYSYFYRKLTDWIACKLNTQKDISVLEDLSLILQQADYPSRALVSVGATCYMPNFEHYFLTKGDEIAIIVFPHKHYTLKQIHDIIHAQTCPNDISAIYQVVI